MDRSPGPARWLHAAGARQKRPPGTCLPGLPYPSVPAGADPAAQFGGPVTAGSSRWVGERGPEQFIAPSNGRIVPAGQSGGGGTTVINNYNRQAAAVAMTMLDMQRRTMVGL